MSEQEQLAALIREMGRAAQALIDRLREAADAPAPKGAGEAEWLGATGVLQQEFAARHAELWRAMQQRCPGEEAAQVVFPRPGDRRFTASEWSQSPFYDYLRQAYLLNADHVMRLVEALPFADERSRGRALYMARQLVDALAPSNFAATNPECIRRALDSGGQSIVQGTANLLGDLEKGRISMSDESAFEVGRNLAITPGAVVHENALMQLIQYAPQTEQVATRPLLIVPPCINRYYILDLSPENSFVRFVVEQGFTVFLVSWKNAGPAEARLGWEDYAELGVLEALDVLRSITRVKYPNVLGFCIGGTLLASALAVAGPRGKVASMTLLTSLLDFAEAGELSCLVDESLLAAREQALGPEELVRGEEFAGVFASLRANDLVWPYVVGNYLQGRPPPAFDLLYWNADGSNLPGPFVRWYLRNTYMGNLLREPRRVSMLGRPLDLRELRMPAYLFAAQEDHIVPWRGAYAARSVLGGETTFVLGASGHIAGTINPPARQRRSYRTAAFAGADAAAWLEASAEHRGSWWLHWIAWLRRYSGRKVVARTRLGNTRFRPIEPAPGRYVTERA